MRNRSSSLIHTQRNLTVPPNSRRRSGSVIDELAKAQVLVGFQNTQEVSDVEAKVEGIIPDYVKGIIELKLFIELCIGVLYRNGPGKFDIDTKDGVVHMSNW